ncbi:MAG: hypothetical protein EXR47_00785 [Dehalococcoidia bacterium]|nr:hypothetical protein [Dehalococcoidia bacterium]
MAGLIGSGAKVATGRAIAGAGAGAGVAVGAGAGVAVGAGAGAAGAAGVAAGAGATVCSSDLAQARANSKTTERPANESKALALTGRTMAHLLLVCVANLARLADSVNTRCMVSSSTPCGTHVILFTT